MTLKEKITESTAYIQGKTTIRPTAGIILGTGLGRLADSIVIDAELPYSEIPHFVAATVEHHAGKLILGMLGDTPVVCMAGRFHTYEGYSASEITFPVRVMKTLGCSQLLISNVAGGLNQIYQRGDIMILDDHINLLGTNPLIGPNDPDLGDRWPDMIEPYDQGLQEKGVAIARTLGIRIQPKGVYACMSGPSLETRAEYRMLQMIGADAVGMSTVPEVIAAVHAGLKVFACSIITDLCYPSALGPVNIAEIIETAGLAEPKLVQLFSQLVSR
ncbi:MAG: purine-nucleoside phosphorylase [Proteobacteria bacterium]|nr:purine-nucleoside phosphorylase [Pseudomonadota bacterium]